MEIRGASRVDVRGNNHAVLGKVETSTDTGYLTRRLRDCTLGSFNGDVRIGQRATPRVVNLPAEYRGEYVDDARV